MTRRKGETRSGPRMADEADPFVLYERSVHDPVTEVDFLQQTFRRLRGRQPRSYREDFSGAGTSAAEWVRRGPRRTAVAVDIDPAVQEWGRAHCLAELSPSARERLEWISADVLEVRTTEVDVISALNFSYWVFRERERLLQYFRNVLVGLGEGGLFILDAFGGYEAFQELSEHTDHGDFTYVWDQAVYHPVTGYMLCHIHFHFPDGSKLDRAFSYDWRLWTLPELQEVLQEAGFRKITVHWEGDDGEGGGNGVFTPTSDGTADAGWIAYIVAEK